MSLAGLFRFTFQDWDEGTYLHPDERFLAGVVSAVRVPRNPLDYLRSDVSTLNPRNRGVKFFVYGDLPVTLVRLVVESLNHFCTQSTAHGTARETGGGESRAWLARLCTDDDARPRQWTSLRMITHTGRFISALFSLAAVLLTAMIGACLFNRRVGLLALWLSACCVLAIQSAHFFTVDAPAAFFVLASFYAMIRARRGSPWLWLAAAGALAGAAIACRLNLLLFVAPLMLGAGAVAAASRRRSDSRQDAVFLAGPWVKWLEPALVPLALLLALRVLMPSAFGGWLAPDPRWLHNIASASAIMQDQILFPPAVQWTGRVHWWFPWRNMVVWGMGLSLGLCAWIGWARWGWRGLRRLTVTTRRGSWRAALCRAGSPTSQAWLWVALLFAWQGGQWVMSMRYFLPIYPFLILFAAWLLAALWERAAGGVRFGRTGRALAVIVLASTLAWAVAFTSIYRHTNTRVAAARWMLTHIQGPATITYEEWDDPLPFGAAGRRAGYRLLKTTPYDEDTPAKRRRLLDWLDQADYVVLSSNRLYASIPRQPLRYPLTSRYYRLLFAGRLGFEPVAEFVSYPRLGPLSVPDQEAAGAPLILSAPATPGSHDRVRLKLPPAEEAFSVYDHPRVLIFAKQPGFSRDRVARRLAGLDLAAAYHGFRPSAETAAPNGLLFTPSQWHDRETVDAAGSRLITAETGSGLWYAAAWWLTATLLGWLVFPIIHRLMPGVADGGTGMARVAAIVLVSFTMWTAASIGALPNSRGTAVLAVLAWGLIAFGVWRRGRSRTAQFLHLNRRIWVSSELVFAVAFLAAVLVRAANPDLWDPVYGGEKPMDLAYLNAVLRSPYFPPHDPWFALGTMNYYYFGLVMASVITRLTATPTAAAYSLALALWFALVCQAAFSLGHNLCARAGGRARNPQRADIACGLLAVLLVACIGNLAEPWLLLNDSCPLWSNAPCLFWDATRAIPAAVGEAPPITEFPLFTFLYGDLHAHFLSLPVLMLLMGMSMSWLAVPPWRALDGRRPWWFAWYGGWSLSRLAAAGVLIAVLRMTNAWDYPTAVLLILSVLALGTRRCAGCTTVERAGLWLAATLVVLFAAAVASLPFVHWFATGYGSIDLWQGSRTPIGVFLLLYGIFFLPLLMAGVALRLERRPSGGAAHRETALPWYFVAGLSGVVLAWLTVEAVPVLGVTAPLAIIVWLLWRAGRLDDFAACCLTLALLLCTVVELVHLRGDVGRMNTVFKFSYHAWVLLAIPAAVLAHRMWTMARGWPAWLKASSRGALTLAIAGGLVYPVLAVPARLAQRFDSSAGWGLDGMAYMRDARLPDRGRILPLAGDYDAIAWMLSNIHGLPVIAEAGSGNDYTWGGRISIYTGFPTILGWRYHEVQQRSLLPPGVINRRLADLRRLYGSGDPDTVTEVVRRYHVSYIYVGALERAHYAVQSLAVFERMRERGELDAVYRHGDTVLYHVVDVDPLKRSVLRYVPSG